ncbi:HD family hydrolase [Paracoccus sp. p4-l81]|uniref:HD domain-containing protein n=1 Tax=Paracoccus sp. p4-l81 TaxID=3342806 RepID=UPI0035B8F550
MTDPEAAARRLDRQIAFLTEADRLKTVLRATPITDQSRPENSAEHSWHLALYALILADHARPGVNIDRVIRMLILHDLVEIDVGDVPIHANGGQSHASHARLADEAAAADRIFGLLPDDLATDLRALWDEFEEARTEDAIFAKSLDRVQPVLMNLASGGGSWRDYAVTLDQVETRVGTKVARGAPRLWQALQLRLKQFFNA